MSTQRIEHAVQGYTYQRPKKARADVDFPLGPEQSKKRQEDAADSDGDVRGHVQALLAQVPGNTKNWIAFADVVAHHEALQAQWNREVDNDLSDLGVNTQVPFRMIFDPAGTVTVAGDHPDKDMIERYFSTNPARVRELGDILKFGRLASAAENMLASSEMGQPLKIEAMAWWYSSNMDTSSLFSGGGMLFGAGGTVYRGLDLRV